MININAIFKNKQLDAEKLSVYGFVIAEEGYRKDVPIMQGQFLAQIFIGIDGKVDFRVFDLQSKEEYALARVSGAAGTFVGEVHKACEEVLSDIAQKCFHTEYFKGAQSKRILHYIKEKYGAEPEFLWSKLPECAALRVPGKKSWFAVVGRIEKGKFGLDEGGTVETINLKDEPSAVSVRINEHRAFPAYHMNKRHWYSIFLDDSLSDAEVISLIGISYASVNS